MLSEAEAHVLAAVERWYERQPWLTHMTREIMALRRAFEEYRIERGETLVRALEEAGARPEIIYAVRRTGRVVTEENRHLLTPKDLAEWEAAIDEYRAQ